MIRKIVLILIVVAAASFCQAQEETMSQEQQQAMIQQQKDSMVPMLGQMMKAMLSSTFDVLSEPESAEKLASFTKNYYDALIKKGFSKDEALKIVTSVGMPSMPSMQN
jgi:hypothetical protein